jgi:NAD(P)H-hydrate epimerase
VVPIGIPPAAFANAPLAQENVPSLWLKQFPWPRAEGHKYHRGYAAVVGGDSASTGAARLAALSALRVGAGLVSVVCSPASTDLYAASLTSVMVKPMKDIKAFEAFLDEPHRDAVLAGPGSGVSPRTRTMALAALKRHKKVVLDADALTVFEAMPERLFTAIKASGAPVVLTPHHAEFRRVFDTISGGSKIELAKKAAALSGATVLLKGNDTVIASPDGRTAVNTNAPATLATAGAGDVLAGLIVGLLAMGMDGFSAACAGAWMHGEAARRFGFGLIAEDLPGLIPAVLHSLVDSTSHEFAIPALAPVAKR